MRESAIAKAQADQERVLAETLSQAKQAEAQRDLEIKQATYSETVKKQEAQADKAYEIQTNVMQQQVVAEAVRVQQIEREQQIKVQEAEILRREKELIATVLKQAEVERQRIAVLAEAEKSRLIDRGRRRRAAVPHAGRGRGRHHLQEGRRRGARDEREGRGVPGIQPGRGHRQAADRRCRRSSRALAAPLKQGGQDHHRLHRQRRSTGMHKITGDMTEIAAQVPALFEALSGMPMADLLSRCESTRCSGGTLPGDDTSRRRRTGKTRMSRRLEGLPGTNRRTTWQYLNASRLWFARI